MSPPDFQWNAQTEAKAIAMRAEKKTYNQIAAMLSTTATAVKHKVRRIQQSENQDRYKHTTEKTGMYERTMPKKVKMLVLETHCGFGGMTEIYSRNASVTSIDIDAARIVAINLLGLDSVTAIHADSEKMMYQLIAAGKKFHVIDIDGYGMPSRYFPHVFSMIDDGVLYVTLPMIGVAQINKITIEHLRVFWGVAISDKESYVDKVFARMVDYAFMHKREIELLEVMKIERIYRLAIRVKKESLLKIVGLKVNRRV